MTTAIYTHPVCKLHKMGESAPECPARIQVIEDKLVADGLDRFLDYRLAPEASIEDIQRVHLLDNINWVRDNVPAGPDEYVGVYDMTLNQYSWEAARRAAGATIAATDAVLDGEIDNAFCLVRPIGHHATPSTPMGFSVFNSVAIAAMHALKVRGLERIAIVDFDVHHGNGTDDAFAYEPRVLMVSFYQTFLYPFMGNERERVNMVNVPVEPGADGRVIRQLVTEKWLPALHAHRPQLIYISAGFDAHRDDPIGGLGLVEDDYVWITQQVMAIANQYAQGRIVSSLEGGYNLTALANSAVAHIKTLAGLE
ncbi:MAG: histone deacetylase family protein [Burkholderiaceae bacterium]|nr:histone deacetylase family protein [Burkholderiaceae bacterium]